ncbi:MAG: CvpA family protein [Arcobacteraceae bacterium]|nr:CvpA family protein [Arcobacteraceae bacterium]
MENINLFDLIVLSLIVILGLKGLFRGLTKELFGLIGIVGGVFIASRLAKNVGEIANSIIPVDNESTILLIGFIITLILFWIIAYVLGVVLEKVFSASGLGVFDRLLGFVFGAGKIFLLFAIIAYALSNVKMINDNLQPKLKDSMVFPMLVETGSYIIKLDTSNMQQEVSKKFESAVKSAKDSLEELSKEELAKRAEELKKQLQETTNAK